MPLTVGPNRPRPLCLPQAVVRQLAMDLKPFGPKMKDLLPFLQSILPRWFQIPPHLAVDLRARLLSMIHGHGNGWPTNQRLPTSIGDTQALSATRLSSGLILSPAKRSHNVAFREQARTQQPVRNMRTGWLQIWPATSQFDQFNGDALGIVSRWEAFFFKKENHA